MSDLVTHHEKAPSSAQLGVGSDDNFPLRETEAVGVLLQKSCVGIASETPTTTLQTLGLGSLGPSIPVIFQN